MQARFIFLCLMSAYLLVGVIYLQWNIFYFMYLYWCENVIRIIFDILKMYSTPHLDACKPIGDLVQQDELSQMIMKLPPRRNQSWDALSGRLFLAFVHLFFIVLMMGVMFPKLSMSYEAANNYTSQAFSILFFENSTFNLAFLLCLAYQIGEYVYNFWIRIKYNEQNPLPALVTLSKQDMVLHFTVFLGVGSMLVGSDGYIVGIVMILLRFGLECFELSEKKTLW